MSTETDTSIPAITPFTATAPISPENVADQIISAIEGGIAYWCAAIRPVEPTKDKIEGKPWYACPKLYAGEFKILLVQHEEHTRGAGREVYLTRQSIQNGLDWLAKNHGNRIAEIVNEHGDAETADVFLQACLFGEIIYG